MESIRQVQKRYCSRALTGAIVAGIVLILAGEHAVAKGLVLGTIFSVFNFILMGETLPLKLGKSQRNAAAWSLISLLMRYALVAIPLIMAVKLRQFNLIAVVVGIFMVQVMILAESLTTTLSSFRNKQV